MHCYARRWRWNISSFQLVMWLVHFIFKWQQGYATSCVNNRNSTTKPMESWLVLRHNTQWPFPSFLHPDKKKKKNWSEGGENSRNKKYQNLCATDFFKISIVANWHRPFFFFFFLIRRHCVWGPFLMSAIRSGPTTPDSEKITATRRVKQWALVWNLYKNAGGKWKERDTDI